MVFSVMMKFSKCCLYFILKIIYVRVINIKLLKGILHVLFLYFVFFLNAYTFV